MFKTATKLMLIFTVAAQSEDKESLDGYPSAELKKMYEDYAKNPRYNSQGERMVLSMPPEDILDRGKKEESAKANAEKLESTRKEASKDIDLDKENKERSKMYEDYAKNPMYDDQGNKMLISPPPPPMDEEPSTNSSSGNATDYKDLDKERSEMYEDYAKNPIYDEEGNKMLISPAPAPEIEEPSTNSSSGNATAKDTDYKDLDKERSEMYEDYAKNPIYDEEGNKQLISPPPPDDEENEKYQSGDDDEDNYYDDEYDDNYFDDYDDVDYYDKFYDDDEEEKEPAVKPLISKKSKDIKTIMKQQFSDYFTYAILERKNANPSDENTCINDCGLEGQSGYCCAQVKMTEKNQYGGRRPETTTQYHCMQNSMMSSFLGSSSQKVQFAKFDVEMQCNNTFSGANYLKWSSLLIAAFTFQFAL